MSDATQQDLDEVRRRILAYNPAEEPLDEDTLKKAANYLKWNGMLDNESYHHASVYYFVYDVLQWTEENT